MQLPFTSPTLLAPMEGVTEPCFRDLVLRRNPPRSLGGAFTEFARVVRDPLPRRTLRRHLGGASHGRPVGLQLLGSDVGAMAATAARAVEAGAPLVDLNFGCPAKGALRGCAGSALLDDPAALERLVRAVADAVPGTPVTAKIRAGGADDTRLEELATAAESGGARLLTVHCRTRAEGYAAEADWTRLRRAVAAVAIPVCGNGGIERHADIERLRRETGCAYAMVGRATLADPWIFTGHPVTPADAARFLLDYAHALRHRPDAPSPPRATSVPRLKQLLRVWTAGDLIPSDHDRHTWLTERDPDTLFHRLEHRATTGALE